MVVARVMVTSWLLPILYPRVIAHRADRDTDVLSEFQGSSALVGTIQFFQVFKMIKTTAKLKTTQRLDISKIPG